MKKPFHLSSRIILLILIATILQVTLPGSAAATPAMRIEATGKVTIVIPTQPIPAEETAAGELQHYLAKITAGSFPIIREDKATGIKGNLIHVGPTQFVKNRLAGSKAFSDEEWLMRTGDNTLILTGGRPRGTLYAVYRFLEDVCGVRWWNPWEEKVPAQKVLVIPVLNKRSQPAFRSRDIYMLYGNDNGRFAIRSRLNREGDAKVGAKYGGSRDYGPPYHVHTFYNPIYISPDKYYLAHPDWFVGNGKETPATHNSQLAMSHPGLRQEFLKLLLENIRSSRREALAKQLPPPDVYSVSQNDNDVSFISGPGDEALVKENGGAESAILLDFMNYLADGIKKEFPDVYLDTLAYHNGEQAPTKLNARDNVIIRLTDTRSNVLLPITAQRNHVMRENIENWAKRCKNLRVWDYNITYRFPQLPQPTMQTYQPDLQFFRQHHVEGMFIEFPKPIDVDMRDMKLWVLCKMLEDPEQNYDVLVKEFTDGYYGAAGPAIRQYLDFLQTTATKSKADIMWFAGLNAFTYLTTDFLRQADGLFTRAATAVQNDPVLSQRVAAARTSVDYAILQQFRSMVKAWRRAGHPESTFPLDRYTVSKRYLQAMTALIDQRIPQDQEAALLQQTVELQRVLNTVSTLTTGPVYLATPAKFQNVPESQLFGYSALDTRNYQDLAKVITDKEAKSGYATRYLIPNDELPKYELPMPWGIYDTIGKKIIATAGIKASDVPGPGYHWYKMGETVLNGHDYLYFFRSSMVQIDLNDAYDANNPLAKFEVWANIKFEGPAFPHGQSTDKNAISVERVVLVKK